MAKVADLTPDASNANRGTERGRYALEASLRKYGAGRSILIDRNGRIIAGNKTAETAADVGIDDVIIVQTDGRQIVAVQRTDLDLDSKEARELAYADNRVGELDLSFDPEQLLADLQAGVDLSAFWRQDELDALLDGLTPKTTGDTEPQTDRAEELRQQWGVEPGQLWQLGAHRLICGDCTDPATVARVMGGERAQAVVTDPPYPDEYKHVWVALGTVAFDVCQDDAFLSSLCGHYQLPYVMDAISAGGWAWWWLCIATNRMRPIMHGYSVKVCHKPNVVYRKGNAKPRRLYIDDFAIRARTSEWKESQDDHKWGQAVGLFTEPIEAFSDKAGIIYEPFCGGGTTIIACENLSRRCRAVEISPGYVGVALERFFQHTGIRPVLLESAL